MKLLIISDTHYKLTLARSVIERVGDRVSAVLHLGDMSSDAKQLEMQFSSLEFHYVAGNGDYYFSTDNSMIEKKIVEYNAVKIFMTHGHNYRINQDFTTLAEAAKNNGATVALCGHSHIPFNNIVNGVLVVNPGSLTHPRGPQKKPTYAVLDISAEGKAQAGIVSI